MGASLFVGKSTFGALAGDHRVQVATTRQVAMFGRIIESP
jgi:hypothetical protein